MRIEWPLASVFPHPSDVALVSLWLRGADPPERLNIKVILGCSNIALETARRAVDAIIKVSLRGVNIGYGREVHE